MEIRITTRQVLIVLQVLTWILFIGLSIDAGAFLINPLLIHFFGAEQVPFSGLSGLFRFDKGHYFVLILLLTIPATLKALLFYQVLKIFGDKKLSLFQPFKEDIRRFVLLEACLAAGIGFFSKYAVKYLFFLEGKGVKLPDIQSLHIDGGDVWLFMAVILFIIAQIFKRGIELQTENDLTI